MLDMVMVEMMMKMMEERMTRLVEDVRKVRQDTLEVSSMLAR